MATFTRVERVLHLVRLLMRRGRTLEALIRELGVTERTLYRDLAALRTGGFDVTLCDGAYTLSVLTARRSSPPKRARASHRAKRGTAGVRRSA